MTRKLVEWASSDSQIIISGLSDGRRVKFLPSVVDVVYCWLQIGGYLGIVGFICSMMRQRAGDSSCA